MHVIDIQSMNPKNVPNPFAFAGLSLIATGTLYWLLKRRESTYPASIQPRQHDHPLVPPRQRDITST